MKTLVGDDVGRKKVMSIVRSGRQGDLEREISLEKLKEEPKDFSSAARHGPKTATSSTLSLALSPAFQPGLVFTDHTFLHLVGCVFSDFSPIRYSFKRSQT